MNIPNSHVNNIFQKNKYSNSLQTKINENFLFLIFYV